jgi:sec-independent protein translocase protein TatC
MSNFPNEAPDPEDMFADTRMSFGDHIEDLRAHLLRAIKGLVLGMILGFWPLGPYVLDIITKPVVNQLNAFERRKLKRDFRDKREQVNASGIIVPPIKVTIRIKDPVDEKAAPDVGDKMIARYEQMLIDLEAHHLLDKDLMGSFKVHDAYIDDPLAFTERVMDVTAMARRHSLATMHITEAFMVYMKVAFITGLVLSSPWVFYHIWMFIAAGLYPNEKRLVNVYLPFSLALFIIGVFVCQFLVMDKAVQAMLWFNEWLGLDADLRLNEWLGFALMMPVVFGLSFQAPLVMMFVHKIGVVSVQMFRDKRRVAWFGLSVFAAVITPSVDPVSMLWLWVPLCLLYELGILLCVYQGEQTALFEWEEEEQKSGELVEV